MEPYQIFTIFIVVAAAVLLRQEVVEGARVKIHLSAEVPNVQRRLRPRQCQSPECNTPCADKVALTAGSTGLPSDIQGRLNARVRFFSSATAKRNVDETVFTREVSGLGGQTVRDVFNALLQGDCYPFFYGGLVRDQFLRRMPADVDVEAHCDIHDVQRICMETWGGGNCTINENTLRAHIGVQVNSLDDLIDFASTSSTFFAELSALEYTVNSLAYDLNGNNNIIVDLPGDGVEDVCSKTIQIPSDDGSEQSWDAWRMAQGGRSKLYRFWKLRVKEFTPLNNKTIRYIVQHATQAVEEDPDSFKSFYCDAVYGGKYNSGRKSCSVSEETCMTKEGTAELYRRRYSEDFGDYFSMLEKVIPKCGKYTPN